MTASFWPSCALRVILVGSLWLLLSRPVQGAPDPSEITSPADYSGNRHDVSDISSSMDQYLIRRLLNARAKPVVKASDGQTQVTATTQRLIKIKIDSEIKKFFADPCKEDKDCNFEGGYCEPRTKKCNCREEFPATNHINKCGVKANVNESCSFLEQCEAMVKQTECRDGRCICIFEMIPVTRSDGVIECIAEHKDPPSLQYIDPAMIGVLVGMALMFVILCVVLRLFSKARWRENRTIFNTPNPRLMNVSLLRDSKLLHGQERRGSRGSVRGPSRQPSVASLRAHSPSASQGSRTGSRRGSRGSTGNASATSARSNNKSPPAAQPNNVTVEVLEAVA